MTQNDLLTVDGKTFASKADSIVEGGEVLKGQSRLMFYGGRLYPSARHLLLANRDLVGDKSIDKMVTALNDKASYSKKTGGD